MNFEQQCKQITEQLGNNNNALKSPQFIINELYSSIKSTTKRLHSNSTKLQTLEMVRIFKLAVGLAYQEAPLNVLSAMIFKYPSYGCSYCESPTCCEGCEGLARNSDLPIIYDPEQEDWDIRTWQNHNIDVYGHKNEAKTLDFLVLKIYEELREVTELIEQLDALEGDPQIPQEAKTPQIEKIRDSLGYEFSDLIQSILAVANKMSFDVQQFTD